MKHTEDIHPPVDCSYEAFKRTNIYIVENLETGSFLSNCAVTPLPLSRVDTKLLSLSTNDGVRGFQQGKAMCSMGLINSISQKQINMNITIYFASLVNVNV